eukprot:CAMPEP_0185202200 /NCGR_PEP_ID=MMETSP1140-20130426/50649_1 /TAXON_ID=298111 /ORGANISM="Pavlova sp., Strain CCMP459" /LENGTH=248 /DNA_ID=CAMNT_0027769625 /DNA_START=274 /DNA_END=1017 /DNA_ORIENTATION=-
MARGAGARALAASHSPLGVAGQWAGPPPRWPPRPGALGLARAQEPRPRRVLLLLSSDVHTLGPLHLCPADGAAAHATRAAIHHAENAGRAHTRVAARPEGDGDLIVQATLHATASEAARELVMRSRSSRDSASASGPLATPATPALCATSRSTRARSSADMSWKWSSAVLPVVSRKWPPAPPATAPATMPTGPPRVRPRMAPPAAPVSAQPIPLLPSSAFVCGRWPSRRALCGPCGPCVPVAAGIDSA